MAHPWKHAEITARKFGGRPEEHLPVHQWFDRSKAGYADHRHRAALHHAEGIFWCEAYFGPTITVTLDDGSSKEVPTRLIAEDHVAQDMRWIPSLKDWLKTIESERWMRAPTSEEHSEHADEPEETYFNVTPRGTFPVRCTASEAKEDGFLSADELAQAFDKSRHASAKNQTSSLSTILSS